MGITQIINPFYKTIPFSNSPNKMQVGQIAYVPAQFVEIIPNLFEVERAVPTDHENVKYKIRPVTASDFRRKSKLPIKGLNLNETEELLASKAKLRPCILLARGNTLDADDAVKAAIGRRKHLLRDDAIFVPLYGTVRPDHSTGFPQALVNRIRVLMYRQFYYCPPFTPKKTDCDAFIEESIARLDWMFPCSLHYPAVQPMDIALQDNALKLLLTMAGELLQIPLSEAQVENLSVIKEVVRDSLDLGTPSPGSQPKPTAAN